MRKIIGLFSLIFGLVIIGMGIFMQINPKETKKEEPKEVFENKKIPVKRINKFEIDETCKTYDKVETYINTTDYTKISFSYPNCVHEYNLTILYKTLRNEDKTISIDVRKEEDTIKNYINSIKTKLAANKYDDYYYDLEFTETYTDNTDSGLLVNIIETNYRSGYQKNYYDEWYIAVDLKNGMILTFEVEAKDKVMSVESIKELYKSIVVEEEKAVFLNTKKEGNYQVGTLKQNKEGFYDKGYKVNIKVPVKYPEVATTSSNFTDSVFEIESVYEQIYAWISLEKDTYNKTLEEKIADEKKYSIERYSENPESYRNIKDNGIVKKTINGKEVYYYIFSYDYYLEGAKEKSETNYMSEIFYELEPHFYYKIYLSTKNIEINEALISDFLNFTIEEY